MNRKTPLSSQAESLGVQQPAKKACVQGGGQLGSGKVTALQTFQAMARESDLWEAGNCWVRNSDKGL